MPALLVDTSTDGATLIAAPGEGKFIRILGLDLTTANPVQVSLKSGTTVIWQTEAMNATGGGGLVLNTDCNRTIDCSPNEPLKIGLSSAVQVSGTIQYVIKGY